MIFTLLCFLLILYFHKSYGDEDDPIGCQVILNGVSRCSSKSTLPKYPLGRKFTYNHHPISDRVFNYTKGKEMPNCKYYLSAMSMFKNEAGIMREWLNHHIGHGFEHFYLVNDHSTDEAEDILQPYIRKGLVTMFPAPWAGLQFRQVAVYNKLLTRIMTKNESHWVAVIDLDEFLWSPQAVDLRDVLRKHEDLSVIGLNWLWFGSNGHIEQPNSVIQSFTKRADTDMSKYPDLTAHYKILKFKAQKNIINTQYKAVQVQVHTADVEGVSDILSINRYPDDPPFLLNHYSVQAKDFFLKNKGTRGSANGFYKVADSNLNHTIPH